MATTTKTTTTTTAEATTEVANNGVITIVGKIKSISLYESESTANINVVLDKQFEAIVRTDNGYEVGQADHFYISRGKLTAQACDVNDDIALYRACQTHGFNQLQLALLFVGAKITINRHFHSAGEILDGSDTALENDCYITDIVGVELTDRALRKLDSALTL